MSKTKEALKQELTGLLLTHLDPDGYSQSLPTQASGGLPLHIPYIRLEPWVYGPNAVTLKGAWDMCVETARQYDKTPVLAHQWHGDWVFRMPMAVAGVEAPEGSYEFEYAIEMAVKAFALFLVEYQEEKAARVDYSAMVSVVLGVEL